MRFALISLLTIASVSTALLECYQGKAPWRHEIHRHWGATFLPVPQLAPCEKTARCCSYEASIESGRIYECKDKCPTSLWVKSETKDILGDVHFLHHCKQAKGACDYSH